MRWPPLRPSPRLWARCPGWKYPTLPGQASHCPLHLTTPGGDWQEVLTPTGPRGGRTAGLSLDGQWLPSLQAFPKGTSVWRPRPEPQGPRWRPLRAVGAGVAGGWKGSPSPAPRRRLPQPGCWGGVLEGCATRYPVLVLLARGPCRSSRESAPDLTGEAPRSLDTDQLQRRYRRMSLLPSRRALSACSCQKHAFGRSGGYFSGGPSELHSPPSCHCCWGGP